MSNIEPNLTSLIVFAVAWASFCFGVFMIAGMLPIEAALPNVRSRTGVLLLFLDIVLLAAILLQAGLLAHRDLRWTSVVIAGGLVFLSAPFLVQGLPVSIKDGRTGLLFLLILTATVTLGIWHYGVNPLIVLL